MNNDLHVNAGRGIVPNPRICQSWFSFSLFLLVLNLPSRFTVGSACYSLFDSQRNLFAASLCAYLRHPFRSRLFWPAVWATWTQFLGLPACLARPPIFSKWLNTLSWLHPPWPSTSRWARWFG